MANAVKRKYNEVVSAQGELRQVYLETTADQVIYDNTTSGIAATEAQSAIDLLAADMPTSTSDLTNDGDGSSPFATEEYVDENGGKIDAIKVNNVEQTITDKTVNISVPTKTSDITNDSGFITEDDVPTYTAGNNITINNGVIGTVGTQSGTGALAIGDGSQAEQYSTAIGCSARASIGNSIALGSGATSSNNYAIAIGRSANASVLQATAIGYNSRATAENAVQIGQGTNSVANSLQFRTTQIVNGSGKIPAASLDTEIPTKTSDLTNDSGFITSADIPTKTSDLTNDSGFITSAAIPDISGKVNKSGDTMSGSLTFQAGESAYNDKGIIFSNGSKIGGNNSGDIGIYAKRDIYLRTLNTSTSSTHGVKITSTDISPTTNKSCSLGTSSYQYNQIRGNTIYQNGKQVANKEDIVTASDTDYTAYIGAI